MNEQHAITLRNQQQSPLLRLPSELRNRIYDFAVGGHDIKIYQVWIPGANGREERRMRLRYHLPGGHSQDSPALTLCLMGACRQLHDETTKLFYATNTFQGRVAEIIKFIALIAARAKYMRTVRIDARYAISYDAQFTEVLDLALYDLQQLPEMSRVFVQTRWTCWNVCPKEVILRNLEQTRQPARQGRAIDFVLENSL